MTEALRMHWPEYLAEAAGLGLFMVSATFFAALLEHTASPARAAIPSPFARRAVMGLLMGLTAVALIYSPFGQRSGAHMNPAVTLTFLRLGKIAAPDALFYVIAQCLGGWIGCVAGARLFAAWPGKGATARDAFAIIATVPGSPGARGAAIAFGAEAAIAFGMMFTVLVASNSALLSKATGLFAGALVALYIAFEAPLSGMSLNPARSLASAIPSGRWDGFWIYLTAPFLGMLVAAGLYTRACDLVPAWHHPLCAKLAHETTSRCIFRCEYAQPGVEHE